MRKAQRHEIGLTFAEQRSGKQNLPRDTIAHDPEHFMTDIWTQSIHRQNEVPLLLYEQLQSLPIGYVKGHQLFIL
jgi:hypothetical protein